jgi:prepilin-type N-terminal cleavage/methylation domain-containing protein
MALWWNTSPKNKKDRGFSLPEVLVVVVIIGVLAAIAIPVSMNQQNKAINASIKSDLTSVAAAVETQLMSWRGAPPDTLNICHGSPSYPTTTQPTNTCNELEWKATLQSNGNPTTPSLAGRVSPGVIIQGRVASDGSYCLDGSSTRNGSSVYYYDSIQSQVFEGTCKVAEWMPMGNLVGSTGATTTPGNLPSPPSGLNVVVDDETKTAIVQWNAQSGTVYAVKVTDEPVKTFTAASTGIVSCMFPADTCDGEANGQLAGGNYTATVRGGNGDGWGAGANKDFKVRNDGVIMMVQPTPENTTPVDTPTVPGAPLNLTAIPSNQAVSLQWDPPASDGGKPVLYYTVIVYPSLTGGMTYPIQYPTNRALTGATIGGLTNGKDYTFLVRATNEIGTGPYSLDKADTARDAPDPPGIVSVTSNSTTSLIVNFIPGSNNGSAIVNYEYSLNSGLSWSEWTPFTPPRTTSPLTINNLISNTTYQVRIRAVNGVGPGLSSDALSATTQPSPPDNVKVAISGRPQGASNTYVVSWSHVPGSPTGYVLERRSTTGGVFPTTPTATYNTTGSVNSVSISGLSNNQSHWFQVKTLNGTVSGPLSDGTGLAVYTNVGNHSYAAPPEVKQVSYLIVAGGGGGNSGGHGSGGGGAGGLLEGVRNVSFFGNTIPVTVGGGGGVGANGGNSAFVLTATGGGRGGNRNENGQPGGSGGGGGSTDHGIRSGGAGIAGQGHAGGRGNGGCWNCIGGGGGGAGSAGQNSPGNQGGAGGLGIYTNISGALQGYAGGGGGGANGTRESGWGIPFGGGRGGHSDPTVGVVNTGGGGGGRSDGAAGAGGGSGIVIVRSQVHSDPIIDSTILPPTDVRVKILNRAGGPSNTYEVSWTEPSTGVLGYRVERYSHGGNGDFPTEPTEVYYSTLSTLTINNLSNNLSHYFVVRSASVQGYSQKSGGEGLAVYTRPGITSEFVPAVYGTVSYLVVAGGGGGNNGGHGSGGGGAGGLRQGTLTISTPQNVTVGNQGLIGQNGGASTFASISTVGGGRGGNRNEGGQYGGSGGGGGSTDGGIMWGGNAASGQGYPGGRGNGGCWNCIGGGGGGAGGMGQHSPGNQGGAGGVGIYNDITGSNQGYAGGGGGGANGTRESGWGIPFGGGRGGHSDPTDGINNTGGGGGGRSDGAAGANGGHGIVIIKYLNEKPLPINSSIDPPSNLNVAISGRAQGGTNNYVLTWTTTSSLKVRIERYTHSGDGGWPDRPTDVYYATGNNYTIFHLGNNLSHYFVVRSTSAGGFSTPSNGVGLAAYTMGNSSFQFRPQSPGNVQYLLVAGGGGANNGGHGSGGGGAGGLLQGTLSVSTTLSLSVGRGGQVGNNGQNSSLGTLTAIGGGRGGNRNGAGQPGGSGGGGGSTDGSIMNGGAGTSGQGNAGGRGNSGCWNCIGGGGGGAGGVGQNSPGNQGGAGGIGIYHSITGSSQGYAGGGGGGANGTRETGQGWPFGGGRGGHSDSTDATTNSGSGGGGRSDGAWGNMGADGIVVLRYTR